MKNNPDFLQESEVENADADLTTNAGKINGENDNMNISMGEDQDNMKHQKTLKVDFGNTAKNKKTIWRPIYEVIHAPFFEETNIFPNHF